MCWLKHLHHTCLLHDLENEDQRNIVHGSEEFNILWWGIKFPWQGAAVAHKSDTGWHICKTNALFITIIFITTVCLLALKPYM